MAFTPGDWVELVRDVSGASNGQRGKVTSTGFLGGLDIRLETGATVRGVDASAVAASGPSTGAPVMPGDWVVLVRDVPGASHGQRGKVTATGFLGGLDIQFDDGNTVRGVDRSAVVSTGPSTVSSSGGGSRVLPLVAALLAAALIVVAVVWIRWGT